MDKNDDGKLSFEEESHRVWFMFIDADENDSLSVAEYGNFNSWLVASGHCQTVFDLMDKGQRWGREPRGVQQ